MCKDLYLWKPELLIILPIGKHFIWKLCLIPMLVQKQRSWSAVWQNHCMKSGTCWGSTSCQMWPHQFSGEQPCHHHWTSPYTWQSWDLSPWPSDYHWYIDSYHPMWYWQQPRYRKCFGNIFMFYCWLLQKEDWGYQQRQCCYQSCSHCPAIPCL